MKSKKILATAALTTVAAMQLMFSAMAQETSNSATDSRKGNDAYQNTAHTTFGVIETNQDVSGQVSYEVPLFVTMAATPGRSNMLLPTDDQYYIENTSGDIKDADKVIETNPIGVVGLSVEGLPTNTWKIKKTEFNDTTNKGSDGDNHTMTFEIAEFPIGDDTKMLSGQFTKVVYDNSYKTDGVTPAESSWKNVKTKNQFVNLKDYAVDDQGTMANSLVKIGRGGARLNVKLKSTIANLAKDKRANNGDTATTGLFKVKYTLAALDENGQPKLAAVYAGDNWIDAGYKTNPTK